MSLGSAKVGAWRRLYGLLHHGTRTIRVAFEAWQTYLQEGLSNALTKIADAFCLRLSLPDAADYRLNPGIEVALIEWQFLFESFNLLALGWD